VEGVGAVHDGDLARRHQRAEGEPAGQLAHLLGAHVAAVVVADEDANVGMGTRRHAAALVAGAAGLAAAPRAQQRRPASVRLPTPTGPEMQYAAATRPWTTARRRRRTAASWPMTSAKVIASRRWHVAPRSGCAPRRAPSRQWCR